MELLTGRDLYRAIKEQWPFEFDRIARIGNQILSALDEAHAKGVVHRDLKPENILVVAPADDFEVESVRVVDFGLAKLLAEAGGTSTGAVVGTPFYMSPEQCLGEPLDARSDVYSLGAMFYEMLSGKRPFEEATVSGLIDSGARSTYDGAHNAWIGRNYYSVVAGNGPCRF